MARDGGQRERERGEREGDRTRGKGGGGGRDGRRREGAGEGGGGAEGSRERGERREGARWAGGREGSGERGRGGRGWWRRRGGVFAGGGRVRLPNNPYRRAANVEVRIGSAIFAGRRRLAAQIRLRRPESLLLHPNPPCDEAPRAA